MPEFHRYSLQFDVNGLVEDEDKVPLKMKWPDLKANNKITQLWKVGNIDYSSSSSVNHEYNSAIENTNIQNISSQLLIIS